ncbi:hypothetical protein C0Z20_08170 [Trinickia symbiotica]|uniref:Uncharacterized protein n=1 Tax=Trinickia symbiotica TaxID=863227 RepID=A0A2N7X6A0_9BURK|nr:hypothetical protein C0Z20_08170 [Trinickia symbiotica]
MQRPDQVDTQNCSRQKLANCSGRERLRRLVVLMFHSFFNPSLTRYCVTRVLEECVIQVKGRLGSLFRSVTFDRWRRHGAQLTLEPRQRGVRPLLA